MFRTKAEATQWLATVEADLLRGEHLDPSTRSQRFAPYAHDWLAAKTELRPKTAELYGYLLEVHLLPYLGERLIGRIDSATVRQWNSTIRSGRISDTTAAKAYRLLRQILQSAVDDRLLRENPCRIKGAAVERSSERQIPTVEQVLKLADAVPPRYRALVLVAAFAGLRRGECWGLARRHIDLAATPPTITVERSRVPTDSQGFLFQPPKTVAGHRRISLPDLLTDELRRHLDLFVADQRDALVFTDERTSDTPTPTVWRLAWDKARRGTNVACTLHDLRHVAGTLNAAAGATIKEAMARLGHSSPEAALRYQHAVAARDAEIAAGVNALIQS